MLYRACASGDLEQVAAILEATPEAAKYETDEGETCLHAACEYHVENYTQHDGAIPQLVAAGCNINQVSRSAQSMTPLMAACYYGHATCVEQLLKLGADVNVKNARGETALDFAVLKMGGTMGHTKCRTLLQRTRARRLQPSTFDLLRPAPPSRMHTSLLCTQRSSRPADRRKIRAGSRDIVIVHRPTQRGCRLLAAVQRGSPGAVPRGYSQILY